MSVRIGNIVIDGKAFSDRRAYKPGDAIPNIPAGWKGRRRTWPSGWTFDRLHIGAADLDVSEFVLKVTPLVMQQDTPAGHRLTITEAMFPGANGDDFFASAQADGGDIRLYKDANCTQRLAFHLEHFDRGAKEIGGEALLTDAITSGNPVYFRTGTDTGGALTKAEPDHYYGREEILASEALASLDMTKDDTGKGFPFQLNDSGAGAGPLFYKSSTHAGNGEHVKAGYNKHTGTKIMFRAWAKAGGAGSQGRFITRGGWAEMVGYFAGKYQINRQYDDDAIVAWAAAGPGDATTPRLVSFYHNGDPDTLAKCVIDGTEYATTKAGSTGSTDLKETNISRITFGADFNDFEAWDGELSLCCFRKWEGSDADALDFIKKEQDNLLDPGAFAVCGAQSDLTLPIPESDLPAPPNFKPGPTKIAPEFPLFGVPLHDHLDEAMAGMMALKPSTPDATAVQDGYWNDPDTWGGVVPGASDQDILIPQHIRVVIDSPGVSSAGNHHRLIWVDGILQHDPDAATLNCYTDTLIISRTGVFAYGYESAPHEGDITWHWATGQIDLGWDPGLQTRGMMRMGQFLGYGSPKDPVALSQEGGISSGMNRIQLDGAPPGNWKVGDLLGIPGVRLVETADGSGYIYGNDDPGNESEYGSITAIGADYVDIDTTLTNDHTTPVDWPTAKAWTGGTTHNFRKIHIFNLTRNVTFKSPASAEVWERGHGMGMLTNDSHIYNTAFWSMGRTDKLEDGYTAPDWIAAFGPLTYDANILARYAWHEHGAGLHTPPSHFEGNAIYDMRGLGLDNHASNIVVLNNCSAKSNGAQYMEEAGDEKGRFEGWFAMDHVNPRNDYLHKGGGDGTRHDWGHSEFLWFNSRQVPVKNVFCYAGTRAGAIQFNTRGTKQHKAFSGDWDRPELSHPRYANWNADGPDPADVYYSDRTEPTIHPIDLDGVAGIAVWQTLGVTKEDNSQTHGFPSHLRNIVGLEVFEGAHIEYTDQYVHSGYHIHRSPLDTGAQGHAIDSAPGINISIEAMHQTIRDSYFKDFATGVEFDGLTAFALTAEDSFINFIVPDTMTFDNCTQDISIDTSDGMTVVQLNEADFAAVTPTISFDTLTWDDVAQRVPRCYGALTDEGGSRQHPPAREKTLYESGDLRGSSMLGILRKFGYWQDTGGSYYVEIDEHFYSPFTGQTYTQKCPLWLPLEPTKANGFSLATDRPFPFNGVKAAS